MPPHMPAMASRVKAFHDKGAQPKGSDSSEKSEAVREK